MGYSSYKGPVGPDLIEHPNGAITRKDGYLLGNRLSCGGIWWRANPEFEKLKSHPEMEALRDRTIKIEVPYLEEWKDGTEPVRDRHAVGVLPASGELRETEGSGTQAT